MTFFIDPATPITYGCRCSADSAGFINGTKSGPKTSGRREPGRSIEILSSTICRGRILSHNFRRCSRKIENIKKNKIARFNRCQTLASRELFPLKPALVHIGTFLAVDAYNVIAEQAILEGTVRTTDSETKEFFIQRIPALARRLGAIYGTRVKVDYLKQYPSVINSPKVTKVIEDTSLKILGPDQVKILHQPTMIAEDFSFYTDRIPGALIFLGTRSQDKGFTFGLHNGRFNFNEELILARGIRLLGDSTRTLLRKAGQSKI